MVDGILITTHSKNREKEKRRKSVDSESQRLVVPLATKVSHHYFAFHVQEKVTCHPAPLTPFNYFSSTIFHSNILYFIHYNDIILSMKSRHNNPTTLPNRPPTQHSRHSRHHLHVRRTRPPKPKHRSLGPRCDIGDTHRSGSGFYGVGGG